MEESESGPSLRQGDSVKLRIRKLNPNNVEEDYLTGKVVDLPPFGYPGDVAVLVNTPKDPETHEHTELDLRPLGSVPMVSAL